MIDSKRIKLRVRNGIYRDFKAYTKEVSVRGNKRSVKAFIRRVR